MSEPQSTAEEFEALRRAAERRDRNGCWDATQKLLRRLPARQALRLACGFVALRLPAFERHHPGVHWPREFIASVTAVGAADTQRVWPEAEDDFPGPGANSFTRAVEALWKASLAEDAQRRNELLADSLVGAINAERLEHWGTRHPEAWALWYQLASRGREDPRIVEIQLTTMKDPEAVRVETAAWRELTEHLAEALNAATHQPR